LLFYIKILADRLASRLLGRGERVSRFSLRLWQMNFSHVRRPLREFIFELPLAQSAGTSLLSIIRERLNFQLAREPLQSEVERVELKVLDTNPLKTPQRNFFNRDEEERETRAGLFGRLEERLGKNSVFAAQPVASYVPEKSWCRQMSEDFFVSDAGLPAPPRPLRIFKKPLPLTREGCELRLSSAPVLESVGTHFATGGKWRITAMEGPERVREEWWFSGLERDYYRVETLLGEKLWVFQRPGNNKLFLHGVFD
jgi:protein ImuB